VLEIADKVVVCVNMMDEARTRGVQIDVDALSRDLGVPVVATVARTGQGLHDLTATVAGVAQGDIATSPHRLLRDGEFQDAVTELLPLIERAAPGLPNAHWVAIRILDGDRRVREALTSGELARVAARQEEKPATVMPLISLQGAQ
jgi:ferrous iron transport protein B